jgi:hypothetical protein
MCQLCCENEGKHGWDGKACSPIHETNGESLYEGKDLLPFALYHQDDSVDSVFAHCFLVLTWNVMSCSQNTVTVMREHMSWRYDSMKIEFANTKTDLMGKRATKEQHLYANPKAPEICPIVATATYLAKILWSC